MITGTVIQTIKIKRCREIPTAFLINENGGVKNEFMQIKQQNI